MHPRCRCSAAADAKLPWEELEGQEAEETYIKEQSPKSAWHVNTALVNTKAYHDRFMGLTESKMLDEGLYREAMEILKDRNNTGFEDIVALDARTGRRLVKNTHAAGFGITHQCGFSREEQKSLEERGIPYEVLHNHPNSSFPSRDDIRKLFERKHQTGSTVSCHNGAVYRMEKLKPMEDIDRLIAKRYAEVKEEMYGCADYLIEKRASERIVESLKRSGHISFKEVTR